MDGNMNGESEVVNFDNLVSQITDILSVIRECPDDGNLEILRKCMNKLKNFSSTPAISAVVCEGKSPRVLELLLAIYRFYPPGFVAISLSEPHRKKIKDCLQAGVSAFVTTVFKNEEFARTCLEVNLRDANDAYPFTIVLQLIFSAILKRGTPALGIWMMVGADGQLLLFRQLFQCVGLLTSELCTPIFMKDSDFYTYLLTVVASVASILSSQELDACRICLFTNLHCGQLLSPLFASDVLSIVASVAPEDVAVGFTVDAFLAFCDAFAAGSGPLDTVRLTCIRLFSKLSQDRKIFLLEEFPVRRNFFLWSQLPFRLFLDLGSEIADELYDESIAIINEALTKSRNENAIMRSLCRLPLSLRCLRSIVETVGKKRKTLIDGPQKFLVVIKSFLPLWNLVAAVSTVAVLPLVKCSIIRLLELGCILHQQIPDEGIAKVLDDLCRLSVLDTSLLGPAAHFASKIGGSRELSSDISRLLIQIFVAACKCSDPLARNAAAASFAWFLLRTRCPTVVAAYRDQGLLEIIERFSKNQELTEEKIMEYSASVLNHLQMMFVPAVNDKNGGNNTVDILLDAAALREKPMSAKGGRSSNETAD